MNHIVVGAAHAAHTNNNYYNKRDKNNAFVHNKCIIISTGAIRRTAL